MAEVLIEFDTVVTAGDGRGFRPRACARLRDDGLYEGWIEFLPTMPQAEAVRTPRETLQPNRADVLYWASGLTQTYLDGALRRALPEKPVERVAERQVRPIFHRPASPRSAEIATRPPRAVLNPYEVYQQGENILVQELSALDAPHLYDIVRAYGFASPAEAQGASAEALTRMIVSGVRTPRAPAADSEAPRPSP